MRSVSRQMRSESVISIGCQAGGPEAAIVGQLKVPLYRSLLRHLTSSHCSAIDEYALVIRVDGTLDKFGPEGITRIRLSKVRRNITADIQVPEVAWKPLNRAQLKRYLARQVTAAVAACVSRLQNEKFVIAEDKLFSEIEAACNEYLGIACDG